MPRRADIEGSKSNVAMNAWLPQASLDSKRPAQFEETMVVTKTGVEVLTAHKV
ncbi:hypothetical protein BGZ50_008568 [Haplosporangium sp. Z 11]|nr:hypothetical protein BGZ50_008568 [Haplosporangium sp. Z 11]